MRKIELLSPAKNAFFGQQAILHGADAVYIGAPMFGARAAVGNSIEDIKQLTEFAHLYAAKVYVALNTILSNKELEKALSIIDALDVIGVDAIIIQDVGILQSHIPAIPLHASTQMDVRTPDKARFFASYGIEQIVVPRELTLEEIREYHNQIPNVKLEAFVHGALCVSYSGVCYAAQRFHKRSANRGECSQICRLPYNLYDGNGKLLISNKHLLSIKDLNRSHTLEEMIDAGISSFKIEGRLKDLTYLKTVTSFYNDRLNEIIGKRSDLERGSNGVVDRNFSPNIEKSFNRGFTPYLNKGKLSDDIASFNTPKYIGENIGKVNKVSKNWFSIDLKEGISLNNGDGLSFFLDNKEAFGVRANSIKQNKIYPLVTHDHLKLKKGTTIYRNLDIKYQKTLLKETAKRKHTIDIKANVESGVLKLSAKGYFQGEKFEVDCSTNLNIETAKNNDDKARIEILSKWGDTIFEPQHIDIKDISELFIPRSILQNLKNELNITLLKHIKNSYKRNQRIIPSERVKYPMECIDYRGNVYNDKAKDFYESNGVEVLSMAYEKSDIPNVPLMETNHCIKYSLGWCPFKQKAVFTPKEPLTIRSIDGQVNMVIKTDCRACKMFLYDAAE